MTAIISTFQKAKTGSRKITRRRMDAAQTVKLYEALKDALTPVENGLFVYKEGSSDAKIASAFGINEGSVIKHRVKLFGKLKLEGGYVPYSILLGKFYELERRLASLEEALGGKP